LSYPLIVMSKRPKQSAETEFEEIGGEIVAAVVREQMQTKVAALRDKLAVAKGASVKAAAADSAATDDYLRGRMRRSKSED
jgi:hypothetical protein